MSRTLSCSRSAAHALQMDMPHPIMHGEYLRWWVHCSCSLAKWGSSAAVTQGLSLQCLTREGAQFARSRTYTALAQHAEGMSAGSTEVSDTLKVTQLHLSATLQHAPKAAVMVDTFVQFPYTAGAQHIHTCASNDAGGATGACIPRTRPPHGAAGPAATTCRRALAVRSSGRRHRVAGCRGGTGLVNLPSSAATHEPLKWLSASSTHTYVHSSHQLLMALCRWRAQ